MSWITNRANTKTVRDKVLSELYDMNQDGGVELRSADLKRVIEEEFGYPVRKMTLFVDGWVTLCVEFEDEGDPDLDPDLCGNLAFITLAEGVYKKEETA